jgi:Protein of unknown function (DUF3303)
MDRVPTVGAGGGGTLPADRRQPSDGMTQLGRWFGLNGTGCAVVEAADPKGVFSLVSEWQESLQITATPVPEDDEAGEIVAKPYA